MTTFSYRARIESGGHAVGVIEAETRSEALTRLRADRKTVLEIREGAAPVDPVKARAARGGQPIKREEVIGFAAQLSVMLETGVPIAEALRALIASARNGGMKRVLALVHDSVQAGGTFSQALAAFPKVFPVLMISLVRASEATGALPLMLRRVSDYLGKERRTARQVKGALTYPAIMVGTAVVVTSFLIIFVLPKFAKIYESRSAKLPTPTRVVMAFSDFVGANWIALLAAIAGTTVFLAIFLRTRTGRRAADTVRLRLPVLGPMYTQYYLARATRTLGTLLSSGVPLVDAVRIVRGVTGNAHWQDLWDRVVHAINGGATLGEIITRSRLIPPTVAAMIAAGERTGRLPDAFERIAESAENDLDEAVRTGTQLIEPLMVAFMGVMIGGIAIALLLPIFTIGNVMAH